MRPVNLAGISASPRARSVSKIALRLCTVALVVVIFMFFFVYWKTVEENLQPKFKNPWSKPPRICVEPILNASLRLAAQDVGSHYAAEGMERWGLVQPKLVEELNTEFETFQTNLHDRLKEDMENLIDNVIVSKESKLKKDFPQFATKADAEAYRRATRTEAPRDDGDPLRRSLQRQCRTRRPLVVQRRTLRPEQPVPQPRVRSPRAGLPVAVVASRRPGRPH